MWWQVLLIILAIFVIAFQWNKRKYFKLNMEFKNSIAEIPIVGHAYLFVGNSEVRMNAINILGQEALKQGGVTSVWMAHQFYLMVAEPELAEVILKTCCEKAEVLRLLRFVIGNGSAFAPVPIWRPRRKILAPAFSPKFLAQFMTILSKQSCVFRDQLQSKVGKGPFSMWRYTTAYTMDTIFESTLGVEIHSLKNHEHPFIKAVEESTRLITTRIFQPWLHSDIIYKILPRYRRLMKLKDFGFDYIYQIIKTKRDDMKYELNEEVDLRNQNNLQERQASIKTFLELMIETSGHSQGYTDIELKEETLTLLMAGSDSTATALALIASMLSRYPDVQETVYEELKDVFGDPSRPVVADDLPQLKYLEAVIKETIRLYPPAPILARTAVQDIHLRYRYGMMSMKTSLATILRQYRLKPAVLRDTTNNEHPPLRLNFELMIKDVDDFQVVLESR